MKKIICVAGALLLLTACPKKEEVQVMINDFTEKKAGAKKTIESRDYSLEGLLAAQDYFFNFSEKVHLMMVEAEALKDIQRLITKKGMNNFCTAFILPVRTWKNLEDNCSDGPFYKCSPEIKEYSNTVAKFKELIGPEMARSFENESTCN